MFKIPKNLLFLIEDINTENKKDLLFEPNEIREFVKEYIVKNKLENSQNKTELKLNKNFCDSLFPKKVPGNFCDKKTCNESVMKALSSFYKLKKKEWRRKNR